MSDVDLLPHPRILPMLGEINLEQWRCLAELVDNSIDAFLTAKRAGSPIKNPDVYVTLPSTDHPAAKITVIDNGLGMDQETLANAVRAGWTGNDPVSNLGMFGMGFNIATARLGSLTNVWTTRDGDKEWSGLEIDFEKLIQQKHFRTPRLSRPKADTHEHGTEVTIERLKPEQRAWFAKASNRTKINQKFSVVYSAMLRTNGVPIHFRLSVNGTRVAVRDHCIWGGEGGALRQVQTSRYGIVDSYQQFSVKLEDRLFCSKCWQWLGSSESECPACGSANDVIPRSRRVRGWLGVQRYLHTSDYGLDFIRHGRKIEIAQKELFYWNNDGTLEPEYPIDDPRNRGRIVGEIHIDHCRVTYTKDRFDRNDPAWEEMVRIVRGNGPLRPDIAAQLGFPQNSSHLSLLFQAFRRSSPKPKIAGCYARLLLVPDNERAEEMAKHFYAGETEFQPDTKWWELVEDADRQLLGSSHSTPGQAGGDGLEGFHPTEQPKPTDGMGQEPNQPLSSTVLTRILMPSLNREYRNDETGLQWKVTAYQVNPSDPELGNESKPWVLKKTASGDDFFYVNTEHAIFRSATMTPLDGLLAELAWSAMDFQRGNATTTFSSVLASLRDKYAGTSKLDPLTLSGEAVSTLRSIAGSLSKGIDPEDSFALFNELAPAEQEAIQKRMATKSVPNPQRALDEGRFLEYAPHKTLSRFFENHPELFFDGRYWDCAYATLDYVSPAATEEAKLQVVRYYASLLTDAIWLAEQEPVDLSGASRARLLRAALALELLSNNQASENE
jgi:hypothetical protein